MKVDRPRKGKKHVRSKHLPEHDDMPPAMVMEKVQTVLDDLSAKASPLGIYKGYVHTFEIAQKTGFCTTTIHRYCELLSAQPDYERKKFSLRSGTTNLYRRRPEAS